MVRRNYDILNNGVGYSGSFNYRDAGKLSLNVRELGTPASYPVIGNAVLPVVPLGLRVLDVVRQDNTPNPRTVAAGVEEPKGRFYRSRRNIQSSDGSCNG